MGGKAETIEELPSVRAGDRNSPCWALWYTSLLRKRERERERKT